MQRTRPITAPIAPDLAPDGRGGVCPTPSVARLWLAGRPTPSAPLRGLAAFAGPLPPPPTIGTGTRAGGATGAGAAGALEPGETSRRDRDGHAYPRPRAAPAPPDVGEVISLPSPPAGGCSPVAHPMTRRAAGVLRVDAGAVEDDTHTRLRGMTLRWLAGMVTPAGRDRAASVRGCGRLTPALLADGRVCVTHWRCRDRACPSCMTLRAKDNARSLRGAFAARAAALGPAARTRLQMLTLTQVRRADESAADAYARALRSWARQTEGRYVAGRWWRATVAGSLRAVEVTWRRGAGFHVHFHVVVELAPDVDAQAWFVEMTRQWSRVSDGAMEWGQDLKAIDAHRVGQLAKYVVKPFEVSAPEAARELFHALHSRRMIQGSGSWSSWRADGDAWNEANEPPAPAPGGGIVAMPPPGYSVRHLWADRGDRWRLVEFGRWEAQRWVVHRTMRASAAWESMRDTTHAWGGATFERAAAAIRAASSQGASPAEAASGPAPDTSPQSPRTTSPPFSPPCPRARASP
jgi:hypothetical protein